MLSRKSATARLKSNTVLLFHGFMWKEKIQRAKPFPRIPKTNSVTSSGGSTLISRVPLKWHCMLSFVVPRWLQTEEITPRELRAFFLKEKKCLWFVVFSEACDFCFSCDIKTALIPKDVGVYLSYQRGPNTCACLRVTPVSSHLSFI